ncbi:MAG TPA: ribonuclease HI family protein [Patescibacteria group bacterium]|nr:ribonuclease HI family protein [Patescibacteria group bacterium]
MRLDIYTDGGSRGNPGRAALGVVVKDETGKTIAAFGEYLGEQTNNYAEYQALIAGLEKAKKLGATEVECIMDSELVTKQMNGIYKIREPALQKLFVKAYNITQQFKKVKFRHVLRAKNKEADKLVNQVLDNLKTPG